MNRLKAICAATILFASFATLGARAQSADMAPKPASPATITVQEKMRASLPQDNGQDEEFIHRGFIATSKKMEWTPPSFGNWGGR